MAVIENPVRRAGRPFLLDDECERGVVPRGIQVSGQRVGRGAQRVIPFVAAVGEQTGVGLIAAVLFGMCVGEEFEGGRVARVLDIPPAPVAVPVFQHVGDIDRADIDCPFPWNRYAFSVFVLECGNLAPPGSRESEFMRRAIDHPDGHGSHCAPP